MLSAPGFQNRYIALNEIILRHGDYNVDSLLKPVNTALADRNDKLREKAILAAVRIYDIRAQGTSHEEELLNMLLARMTDTSPDVREIAFAQFKSHSGNRSLAFDARGTAEDRANQIEQIKKWMKNGKDKSVETEFE
jgi:vesicle coat complex subunit